MGNRLLIATDAWFPQVNGVVRTWDNTIRELHTRGYETLVVHPGQFRNMACPLYPEIRLAWAPLKNMERHVQEFEPEHIHIVTEGPIGSQMRRLCRRRKFNFTTSFHTLFPEYLWRLAYIPEGISWRYVRWFHTGGERTLAPTDTILERLAKLGFRNLAKWSRGIDLNVFHPKPRAIPDSERPILSYVGRVSKEKNIEAFLNLKVEGTKYVVGDGPIRPALERRYPEVKFVGYKHGADLAQAYSEADVVVFPSLTDTFGNVLLEALACGAPLASYPQPGPIELIKDPRLGAYDNDLEAAVRAALANGNREYCAAYAQGFSWASSTDQLVKNLVPAK